MKTKIVLKRLGTKTPLIFYTESFSSDPSHLFISERNPINKDINYYNFQWNEIETMSILFNKEEC